MVILIPIINNNHFINLILLIQQFYKLRIVLDQQLPKFSSAIMDDSRRIQNQQYLDITKMSSSQLQKLYQKQDHAVWKTLIKVQQSKRMTDITKAITQIRTAKSFISNFYRNTISKQHQNIYFKSMIFTCSALLNMLLKTQSYKQALQIFNQICDDIHDITLLKQAIFNIFGFSSILALSNYNLSSNTEFKYPLEAQIEFLYSVGKCKIISKNNTEAKAAFEKILILSKSVKTSQYLLIRIYDSLAEIQPLKYKEDYQNFRKNCAPQILISDQQSKTSSQILKKLLIKQKNLIDEKSENNVRISKKMLCLYMKTMLKNNNELNLSQDYTDTFLLTLERDNNQNLMNQILKKSDISVDASKLFVRNINNIKRICVLYYFRKLTNLKNQSKNSGVKNKISKISQQESVQSVLQNSKKMQYIRSSSPNDENKAKQILKKCAQGNYLFKINYGNSSIARRYVRIQQKGLVWGKNFQDANYSSSCCKWKYVYGLTYGKASENISKNKFSQLDSWKCFSLITQDRSFDFCCEEESDIFFWLQGISYKLQVFHGDKKGYPYYSKGRALWKMALLKMKQRYDDPKTKYNCENAGAIITFEKLRHL